MPKSNVGQGLKTQVEFVSANPVGPMHVGHGRWAALGDSLCRVMSHAGYDIQREFYINDHGSQMDVFGNSISYRYMQLIEIMEKEGLDIDALATSWLRTVTTSSRTRPMSTSIPIPTWTAFTEGLGGNAYGGTYIIDEAAAFYKKDGDKWAHVTDEERMLYFREEGYAKMVENMRQLCHDVRCDFDKWFSERTVYIKDTEGPNAAPPPSTAPLPSSTRWAISTTRTAPCGSVPPIWATTRIASW